MKLVEQEVIAEYIMACYFEKQLWIESYVASVCVDTKDR